MKKGFTLIELLVVISIIAMLSSIVLVSLNDARIKGKDSSAIQSMVSMRNAGALSMVDGAYVSNPCLNASFVQLKTGVEKQVPEDVTCEQHLSSIGKIDGWAASVRLNSGNLFCVDSTGYAGINGEEEGMCVPTPVEDGGSGNTSGS